MAKNYHQSGNTVTTTAPRDLDSGEFVVVGPALFGVAAGAYKSGDRMELVTSGVWRGLFSGASEGDPLYHDGAAITANDGSGSNERIGVQLADGLVKLNG